MKKQTWKKIYQYLRRVENDEIINIARIVNAKKDYVVHYLLRGPKLVVVFAILKEVKGEFKLVKKAETKYLGSSKRNGRTQIDGETEINSSAKTSKSAAIVKKLLKEYVFLDVKDKKDILGNFLSNVKYYQHNVDNQIGDGIEELKRSVKKMQANQSDFHYDKLNIMIAENNFVFINCEQYWKNPKTNLVETWEFFDIFRIEGDRIIEHWDIIRQNK